MQKRGYGLTGRVARMTHAKRGVLASRLPVLSWFEYLAPIDIIPSIVHTSGGVHQPSTISSSLVRPNDDEICF
jgi:hypothetical protein